MHKFENCTHLTACQLTTAIIIRCRFWPLHTSSTRAFLQTFLTAQVFLWFLGQRRRREGFIYTVEKHWFNTAPWSPSNYRAGVNLAHKFSHSWDRRKQMRALCLDIMSKERESKWEKKKGEREEWFKERIKNKRAESILQWPLCDPWLPAGLRNGPKPGLSAPLLKDK